MSASGGRQQHIGTGLRGGVTPRHVLPVDDPPHRLDEVDLLVLVLEVEGVLPGVEHEDRHGTLAHVALVVVDLLDDQPPAERLVGEDAPAGALRGRGGLGCASVSLAPFTYAAWCLSWCSSMISGLITGASAE